MSGTGVRKEVGFLRQESSRLISPTMPHCRSQMLATERLWRARALGGGGLNAFCTPELEDFTRSTNALDLVHRWRAIMATTTDVIRLFTALVRPR